MEEGSDVEIFYVCARFTLISESRSTVLGDLPRLTYTCQLYTYLCQVWQDLSVFIINLARF
jgi:hypothetical protein